MGKAQRDKGKRGELDIVHAAKDSGLDAWRIPLSGAMAHYKGDVIIVDATGTEVTIEAKWRAQGFKQIYDFKGDNDVLVLKANGKERIYCFSEGLALELLGRVKDGKADEGNIL